MALAATVVEQRAGWDPPRTLADACARGLEELDESCAMLQSSSIRLLTTPPARVVGAPTGWTETCIFGDEARNPRQNGLRLRTNGKRGEERLRVGLEEADEFALDRLQVVECAVEA